MFFSGCAYLENTAKQESYAQLQLTSPSQRNLKHMVGQNTFLVYGRIDRSGYRARSSGFAVAAYSSRFRVNELVDLTYVANTGTHYGLNLPSGDYDILVLTDRNQDRVFDQSEVVGRRKLELDSVTHPDRVINLGSLQITHQETVLWPVEIPVPVSAPVKESAFYPAGSIRQLSDPVFDSATALLGVYEPAAFLEQAPTMFYALEEDSYKIPVIFVHGIGGSARDFQSIVRQLDEDRYQPWFFYYPSGNDLDQLAELFYDIFLSGNLVERGEMPMAIIAHSMGGLVVREALNRYQHSGTENHIELFISLASPFGGHPGASAGVKNASIVIPAWRDLDPEGIFIQRLFRKPLSEKIDHHILYARGDLGTQRRSAGVNDGIISVASQLQQEALVQSNTRLGFDANHAGILRQQEVIRFIVDSLDKLKNVYPDAHLEALSKGGYEVVLGPDYSDKERYYIRYMGRFFSALINGSLNYQDSPVLERFVNVAKGKVAAISEAETAWLKFMRDYPELPGNL